MGRKFQLINMPMASYDWCGFKFRIATGMWSGVILNWNLPVGHFQEQGYVRDKRFVPVEVATALDAYVEANGLAGLDPVEYLNKIFGDKYNFVPMTTPAPDDY